MAASDLDQVIVKVTADVSDFRSQMKAAGSDLDSFSQKGKEASGATDTLTRSTGNASNSYRTYKSAIADAYGITGSLTGSQLKVITGLEQQLAATKMSGAELAVYTALQRSRTSADSEAGRVIANLALQNFNLSSGMKPQQGLLQSIVGLFGGYKSGAEEATSETTKFREALHAANPILSQFGTGLSGLGGFAGAARAGIAGIAIAAGGALIASLENAGDKARIAKANLDALLGGQNGSAIFDTARKSAEAANVPFSNTLSLLNLIAQNERNISSNSNFRFPNTPLGDQGRAQLGFLSSQSIAGITAAQEAFKAAGLNAVAAQKSEDAFFGDVIKNGGLTLQAFENLRKEAPQVANVIAQALGKGSGATGADNLARSLESGFHPAINDILAGLARIEPQIHELANNVKPTLAQAFDEVRQAWERLETDLAEKGGFTAFSTFLDEVSKGLDRAGDSIKLGISDASSWDDIVKISADDTSIWGHKIEFDALAAIVKLGKEGVDAFNSIQAASKSMADEVTQSIGEVIAAATEGYAKLSSLAGAASVLGNTSGAVESGSAFGPIDNAGGPIIASPSLAPSLPDAGFLGTFDAGGADASDLLQFAAGGLAKVTGSGGTDSQLVQFMATPGEVVAIGNPKSGIGGSAPVNASAVNASSLTSAIADGAHSTVKTLQGQTISIVSEIAKLNASMASLNATLAARSTTAVAAAPLPAAVGGTGFNIANGARGVSGQFAQQSARMAQQDEIQFNQAYAGYDKAQEAALNAYMAPFYATATGAGTGGGAAVSTTIGVPSGSVNFASPQMPLGTVGFGYTDDYESYDPSSDYSSSFPDGTVDYGFFADGGKFTVPGSGATDSVKALMHLTPGEDVEVTPIGGNRSRKIGGGNSDGPVSIGNINFFGGNPVQSAQSRTQVRRAMIQMLAQ